MSQPFKLKRRKRGSWSSKHQQHPSAPWIVALMHNRREREIARRRFAGPWYETVEEMMLAEKRRWNGAKYG